MKVNLVPRSFQERGESGNDVVIKTSVQDMIGSLGAAQRNGAKKKCFYFYVCERTERLEDRA